jgi:hypothetical protein
MRSNFDTPMKLDKDGVAEACGPLEWGPGETEANVTVTISQKPDKVEGTASGSFHPPEDEWMLEVRPSEPHKKFKKGAAHGRGDLNTAAAAAGGSFQWEQDVDLDPDASDDT